MLYQFKIANHTFIVVSTRFTLGYIVVEIKLWDSWNCIKLLLHNFLIFCVVLMILIVKFREIAYFDLRENCARLWRHIREMERESLDFFEKAAGCTKWGERMSYGVHFILGNSHVWGYWSTEVKLLYIWYTRAYSECTYENGWGERRK